MEMFEGPGRLELLEKLGRPLIVGSLPELEKPDFDRVAEALQSKTPDAAGLVEYYTFSYGMMVDVGAEWNKTWFEHVSQAHNEEQAEKALSLALETFGRYRQSETDPRGQQLAGLVETSYGELRDGAKSLRAELDRCAAELKASLEWEDWESFFVTARWFHDQLFLLVWAYASAVKQLLGDEAAAQGLHRSLVSCSVYEMLWASSKSVSPLENVVLLADHLRTHFSGPERKGSVRIVEESDRYRIVLEGCGSGGHLRRLVEERGLTGFEALTAPRDMTWGKPEVPLYCAHCACNELESVQRLGYPLFPAEFQPNPERPCGWTVFKDPSQIPSEYFERLGAQRDPARFVSLPCI